MMDVTGPYLLDFQDTYNAYTFAKKKPYSHAKFLVYISISVSGAFSKIYAFL